MQKKHKETPCSNRKVSFQKNWLLCILGSAIDIWHMDSDHLQVIGWEKKNMFETTSQIIIDSMDWFKGKSTGNHRFSHEIWGVPVNFPLNQSIDWLGTQHLPMISPEGRHAMRGWRHAPCAVGAMRHAPGVPGTACLWFFVNPITEDVPTLGPIYIYI